jgi:hypothetical protein
MIEEPNLDLSYKADNLYYVLDTSNQETLGAKMAEY